MMMKFINEKLLPILYQVKGLERFLGTVETQTHELMETSSGEAKYEHQHKAIVWRVPRLPKLGQGTDFELQLIGNFETVSQLDFCNKYSIQNLFCNSLFKNDHPTQKIPISIGLQASKLDRRQCFLRGHSQTT